MLTAKDQLQQNGERHHRESNEGTNEGTTLTANKNFN
jgi:hypothetical protein